jgi:hypothetical protein
MQVTTLAACLCTCQLRLVLTFGLMGKLNTQCSCETSSKCNNMSSPKLKAAILVVSTTASKNPSNDSSSALLKDVFEKEGGGKWEVVETNIVGDDVLNIQRSITEWADREDAVNVIITTGGTGFAVNDTTPEVGDV